MFISNNFYNNDHAKILKDTLKNFHDFKNKQKGMKWSFLISKSIYILKVYPTHYTLDKTQILKKVGQNITKNALFYLTSSKSSHFYF